MSTKPRALIVVSDDLVEIYSPYHEKFVVELKEGIPSDDRIWNPDKKIWEISGDMYEEALSISLRYFDVVVDICKK